MNLIKNLILIITRIVFSNSNNSINSIGSLMNFKNYINTDEKHKFISKSKNYFIEYDLLSNKLFEKFKSISVIQNIHLNFCKNNNVNKCYQYNPYRLEYLDAKTTLASKLISYWALNGSIIGKFVWKISKQLNLINSIKDPEGSKVFFTKILNLFYTDALSDNYDLVFMHVLVPHKPYGFDKNCNYNNKLSNLNYFMKKENQFQQHNIERVCVILFLNDLFDKFDVLDNFKIIIISDHGSRISNQKNSSLSTIISFNDFGNTNSKIISQEVETQRSLKFF